MKKILLTLLLLPIISNAQIINTIAGNGTAGYEGDGGSATSCKLNNPGDVYVDSAGNIFIADYFNNRIRKIGTTGIITTFAGTGDAGSAGDGGPAILAQLNNPTDIAVDAVGNMYVCEFAGNRVRKIDPSGIISTVAGTGDGGFSGDGSLATAAMLYAPEAICFDHLGNLYIADAYNMRIRMVTTSGIISTYAGTGATGYNGDGIAATSASIYDPYCMVIDSVGNLYFADQTNNRIRKINPSGIISTIAGIGSAGYSGDGGPATAAELNQPVGLFLDAVGNMYIGDRANNRVRKIDATGIITTIAGTGAMGFSGDGGLATDAELNWPEFVFLDAHNNIYFSEFYNNRIRKITNCANGITLQPIGDTVFAGDTATYTVTSIFPAPDYQWQEDPGTGFVNLVNVWPYSGVTTSTLTIQDASYLLDSTHYRCIVNGGSLCSDTASSAILLIKPSTGINQLTAAAINIYPDPAHDNITVLIPGLSSTGNIQLINSIGQIVAKQNINGKATVVNIGLLPSGIYFARVCINGQFIYKKIIKN